MPQDGREPGHVLAPEEGLWRADALRSLQLEATWEEPVNANGSRDQANNARLRRLVADLSLDKEMLSEGIRKKTPP